MRAQNLRVNYTIANGFPGTYTSLNRYNDPSWSWYLNGDQHARGPHFTVAFNARHEVDAQGELVGFHMSITINGFNPHVQFTITNGVATYANRSYANLPQAERALAQEQFETNHNSYLAAARAFYTVANVL